MTSRPRRSLPLLALAWLVAGLVLPGETGAQVVEPPDPLQARPIEFPGFEEFRLENGLRVVVVSYGSQPVASARLYVPGGEAAESIEMAGVADLTATVLTRGTTSRSANEIAEAIEGIGGTLSASAGSDFFSVSATALSEDLETAFDLLADVVLEASFPRDEVELARRQALSSLQAALGQPQTIAQRRFAEVVYGDDHPHGSAATPATVQALERDDLAAFRDTMLRPAGAILLVAGDVGRQEVEALARDHLAEWEQPGAEPPPLPPSPTRDARTIQLVHRPGSVQSVVMVGHGAPPAGHPDYFPLLVMNRILGGGSDARLFRILREEKGWTYGAYSEVARGRGHGVFRAATEVRTEVTDSALGEVLSQLEHLQEEQVSAEELDAARNFLAGSFPLRLETADQVAGQIATTLLLDLPLEDLTRYPERVRAVTPEDVQRVAREHLAPETAVIVVVGDGPALLPGLEELGPVEIVDVEGRPLAREEVMEPPETAWDASALEEEFRRYVVFIQDAPMGSAEYRLERDGPDWVSTSTLRAASAQEATLRFTARGFAPLAVSLESGEGAMRLAADLRVEDGRLKGEVELPAGVGEDRTYDEPLAPGTLLPGMDEYALAIAELGPDARITLPVLDLTRGEISRVEATVTDREEVTTAAGTFDTWRVEVSGGVTPLLLHLRVEAPHLLVRQEFRHQPVRLELSAYGPL